MKKLLIIILVIFNFSQIKSLQTAKPKVQTTQKPQLPLPIKQKPPLPAPAKKSLPPKPPLPPLPVKPKKIVAQKPISQKFKINNAMIFLDDNESISGGAIVSNFALAICNDYYPIIASSNVFYNFLNSTDHLIKEANQTNWKEHWNIYKTPENDLYLFVNKKYTEDRKKLYAPQSKEVREKFSIQDEELYEEYLNGFRLSKLDKVVISDPNIQLIKEINIDNLKSIFVQSQDELFGKWNIFLNGHGFYSENLKQQIEAGILPDKVLSQSAFADSIIAGIQLNKFRNLIQFFINETRTNFLLYSTCFAGNYNIELAFANILTNDNGIILGSQKKPNFLISAGTTLDLITPTTSLANLSKCVGCKMKQKPYCEQIIDKSTFMNFTEFFNEINKYSQNTITATKLKDQELKTILSKILPRPKFSWAIAQDQFGISNMPQVKYPDVDNFFIVDIDNNLSIITNVSLNKTKLEKTELKVDNKDAILIYPTLIDVPINITGSKLPIILSMLPTVNLQKIKKVDALNFDFLEYLNRPILNFAFPKYFYIENFNAKDGKHKNIIMKYQNGKIVAIYTKNNSIFFFNENKIAQSPDLFKRLTRNELINSLLNYFVLIKDPLNQDIKNSFNFELFKKLLTKKEIEKFQESSNNLDKLIQISELNQKINEIEESTQEKINEMGLQAYIDSLKINLIKEYGSTKLDKYKLAIIATYLLEYLIYKKISPINENIKSQLSKEEQDFINQISADIKEKIKSEGFNNYLLSLKLQAIKEYIESKLEEYNLLALEIYLIEYFANNKKFIDISENLKNKLPQEIIEFDTKIKEKINSLGTKEYIKQSISQAISEYIRSDEKEEYKFFAVFLILLELQKF